jgi:hypothetical protein
VRVQFCLAHLIRDIKFLTTLPDARDLGYGEKLRASVKELFGVFHDREKLWPVVSTICLLSARQKILQVSIDEAAPKRHGKNMAKRLNKHGDDGLVRQQPGTVVAGGNGSLRRKTRKGRSFGRRGSHFEAGQERLEKWMQGW